MAITDNQKLDLLYKQAFGVTKTDTATNKSPSNEGIVSNPIVRGDLVWSESNLIPVPTPPTVDTAPVDVVLSVQCVADNTAAPINGISPTWKTNLIDWIAPTFAPLYAVKVYVNTTGTVGDPALNGGILLTPDGSGGTGEFFFNYSSGVLHFMGTPSASLTAGKSIFIKGYRYTGAKGVGSGGGGGTGSNLASDIVVNPAVTAGGTNVQTALEGLNNGLGGKINRSGDAMIGALLLASDPTVPTQAATRAYVDDKTAGYVQTVNGVGPDGSGNVPLTLGTTLTGTAAQQLAATPPSQGDGTVWIISGEVPPLDDNNGQAFIWSAVAAAWLEISPPGTATNDARYLQLSGINGPMTGPLVLSGDPTNVLGAVTKQYADNKFLPLAGGSISGQILLPAVPLNLNTQQAVTKAYVDAAVANAGGGGTVIMPTTASQIDVLPTATITATDVQGAIAQLDDEKVAKDGDTMTGRLQLSADPTLDLHAVTKQYADNLLAGSVVSTADEGKAPVITASGKLDITTLPDGAVTSVNGIDPVNGNVSINFVGTDTGPVLPAGAPTPIGGQTDGVVFIISGAVDPTQDGTAYIWSDAAGAWLEISPPGQASSDARYLRLAGGTLAGSLTMDQDAAIYLSQDPIAPLEAATKQYVDDNAGGGSAELIEFNPTGNSGGITATTVEDALVQLGNEKVNRGGDTMTGMLSLSAGGIPLLPSQPEHVATRAYVDQEIGDAVIAAGAGGVASAVTFSAGGNITATNVQNAITQLDGLMVKRSGDAMLGALSLSGAPAVAAHAANKQYVDDQFAGPVVTAADAGQAPVLDITGKLHISATPDGLVTSVNGIDPINGNVSINFVGTQTGPALPGNNPSTPTAVLTVAPTPMSGQTDGVVFIISDNTAGVIPDPDGQAFIWSASSGRWLEISPPGLASTDQRYLKLSGGTLTGALYLPAGTPVDNNEAVSKGYVDAKVTGGTADTTTFTPGNGSGLTGGTVEDALNQLGRDKVNRGGDTMTGALVLSATPTAGSPSLQAATKEYADDLLAGPVVGGADDAGKAPKLNGVGRLDLSAMATGVVLSVNGVDPINGNVSVNIVGVQTGIALPSGAPTPIQGVTDGVMFIISGSGTLADGSAYIWSDGASEWLEISPPGLASTDARYLKLTGGTLSAPLYLNANPTDPTEASNKAYVDAQIALLGGSVTPGTSIEVTPTTTITATNLQDAIQQLDDKKVAKAGDTMMGKLTLSDDPDQPLEAATKRYVDDRFAGPVVSATAAGRAPILDSTGKLDGSAIGGVVKSVNGIGPEPDGSVVVSLTATQTGPLPLPATPTPVNGTTDGIVYVVSNNTGDPDKNGQAYIWSDSVNAWLEISPPGTAEADARYVNLSGDTMQGPFYLKDDPVGGNEAATKDYVDTKVAAGGGSADNTSFQPGGGITSTTVQDALVFLGNNKVGKGGDTMTGRLDLEDPFNAPLAPTQPQHATNKQYVDGRFAGPVVSGANAGDAPVLASNGKLDKSAMAPETVLSINGITPDPSTGNVPLSFGATQTGTFDNRPLTAADATVYIVSGDPDAQKDGTAYIYSTYTNQWLEISPPGQASADLRYVNLSGDTMAGPLYLPAAAPVGATEAANKKYVDDRVATGPSALPASNVVITNPGNGVTGTDLDSAIFQLAAGKVSTTGDSMSGTLTMQGGATVTGLPQPNSGTDAAHKTYVDGHRFALDGLTDVDAGSPSDNDVLKYDSGSGRWVSAVAPGGSASTSSITPAGNITSTNVQAAIYELDNEKVKKSGDSMTGNLDMDNGATITGLPNAPVNNNDATSKLYVDTLVSNRAYALDDLTNVTVPTPGDGDVLRFNGGNGRWESSNSGPGSDAASVTIVPAGNITSTNVQAAIYELDTEKVRKAGDTMNSGANLTFQGNGTVRGIPSPVAGDDAANKTYVDDQFAGPPTTSADEGKAPVLDGDGRLHISTLPDGAVTSVNGVTPINGNVSINILGTITGDLAYFAAQTPPDPLTPGGSRDGIIFIVGGETGQPTRNGQAYIWSIRANGGTGAWLEISPPGEASADARYLQLIGGTLDGDLTMGTGHSIYLTGNPSAPLEAATKQYVDQQVGSQPVTGTLFTLGDTTVNAGSTQTTLSGLTSVTAGSFTGTLYGATERLLSPRNFEITGDDVSASLKSFDGTADVVLEAVLRDLAPSPALSNSFRKITVDTKGRVTSTSTVTRNDITDALGYTPLNRDIGDVMGGDLDMSNNYIYNLPDPLTPDEAANRGYVDGRFTDFGNALSLNSLNNVNANPNANDVLQWNGGSWVAGTVTASGSITIGGTTINLGGSSSVLDNLDRIGIGSASNDNYRLLVNGNSLISGDLYAGQLISRKVNGPSFPDRNLYLEGTDGTSPGIGFHEVQGDATISTAVFEWNGNTNQFETRTGTDAQFSNLRVNDLYACQFTQQNAYLHNMVADSYQPAPRSQMHWTDRVSWVQGIGAPGAGYAYYWGTNNGNTDGGDVDVLMNLYPNGNLSITGNIGIGSNADGAYGINMPNKRMVAEQVHVGALGVGTTNPTYGSVSATVVGQFALRAGGTGGAIGTLFETGSQARLWYLGEDGVMRLSIATGGQFSDGGVLTTIDGNGKILAKGGINFTEDGGAGIYAQSSGGGYGNNELVLRAGTSGADQYATLGPTGTFVAPSFYSNGNIVSQAMLQSRDGVATTGYILASGNITAFSDERVKKDWISFATDFVSKLAGVKSGTYTRIDEGHENQVQVGVSAQSLREVMPEAVVEDDEGMLSVVYGHAALASSVELAKKVVDLEAQIDELRALVAKLLER